MRRILTDQARARRSHKRGSGAQPVLLDAALVAAPEASADLVAVDEALNQLAKVDERKSQVVEMRFFGALSVEEPARVLNIPPPTSPPDCQLPKPCRLP